MSSSVATHVITARKALNLLGATMAMFVSFCITAAPAQARPDGGEPVAAPICGPFSDRHSLPVKRLGIHLVRRDDVVR